jgi:hypothetical protein
MPGAEKLWYCEGKVVSRGRENRLHWDATLSRSKDPEEKRLPSQPEKIGQAQLEEESNPVPTT